MTAGEKMPKAALLPIDTVALWNPIFLGAGATKAFGLCKAEGATNE